MEALAEVVRKHPGLYVISERNYEHIVFSGTHRSFAALPGMMERTITVNGLSKALGSRDGVSDISARLCGCTEAAMNTQGQFTSGANSIAQRVTIACMGD